MADKTVPTPAPAAKPTFIRPVAMNTVTVSDAMREWFSTGIAWFDKALGGKGIKRRQVIYIWGGPGAGKSTLAQMLSESLSVQGIQTLYNVNEEYIEQVKIRCDELGIAGSFMAHAETDPQKLTELCDVLMSEVPDKHFTLVVDSLQTLNDGKWGDLVNSKTPERCLSHLFEWAKESGATVVVIGHGTKGGVHAGSQKLMHCVDSFAGIMVDRKPKSETFGFRLLQFVKNRMGGVCDPIILDMDKNRGGLLVENGTAFDRELED